MWQDPYSSGLPLYSLCIAMLFFLMGSTYRGTNAVIPTQAYKQYRWLTSKTYN